MLYYLYFWIFFICCKAIYCGHRSYKEYKGAGYNIDYFNSTGQRIEFHGGFGESFSCTLASAFGLIFSPIFLAIETLKFLPAAFVLYLIS
ncbi:MAG: hypothetical protein U5J62_08375 [Desulfurivibrio sp.]|nr:hypothetical protein [Desulfurivibrio sp.]